MTEKETGYSPRKLPKRSDGLRFLGELNHGTRSGWILDPAERTIVAFPARQQPRGFREAGEVLPVLDSIEGLQLSIDTIFGWLKLV